MLRQARLRLVVRDFALISVMCLWRVQAMAADGLTTLRSGYGPKDTIERLEAAVKAKGMTEFARIDHAAGAAEVGLGLRPTELLIFGNAKGGTPLMQSVQTIGIDLPLKALVWQDASGSTWLSYNNPSWLAKRHGLGLVARPTPCPAHPSIRIREQGDRGSQMSDAPRRAARPARRSDNRRCCSRLCRRRVRRPPTKPGGYSLHQRRTKRMDSSAGSAVSSVAAIGLRRYSQSAARKG
jgi:uncharacterized protein (DUF302 family)